jgi:hypothetical protein
MAPYEEEEYVKQKHWGKLAKKGDEIMGRK